MVEKTRVVYVAGSGRSGSTVFGQVLGAVPGWVFCGELRQGFSILAENRICGCGTPARECDFWREVIEHAFGTFDLKTIERAAELTQRVSRHRHSLVHLSPIKTTGFVRQDVEYGEILSTVYQSIRHVSGCDVIVDSSKIPSYYFTIKQSPVIETSIVHIVRDSRAVYYSNKRKKRDPSKTHGREYLLQQGLALTSIAWNLKNGFISTAMAGGENSLLLRYEDFVADPSAALRQVTDLVGSKPALPAFNAGDIEVGTQHTLGGNPVKFRTGPVRLRLDDEWQSKLNRRDRVLVTALTWPMIAAYGYLGSGARTERATVAT